VRLKEYLDNNGIQYKDFAARIAASPNTILTIIKKGSGNCKLSVAMKIVEATMGVVTFDELMNRETVAPSRRGPYKRRDLQIKRDDKANAGK
jgi:hypothetical protein